MTPAPGRRRRPSRRTPRRSPTSSPVPGASSPARAAPTRWRCCAATVFEGRKAGWHVVGATVDHGLQDGSAERADGVVAPDGRARRRRDASARGSEVEGAGLGRRRPPGRRGTPCSRRSRERFEAAAVLLGHTRDDQAETVLLGPGPRVGRPVASPGCAASYDRFVARCSTSPAPRPTPPARSRGSSTWDDPHNDDPAFTRVRVRHTVLPVLEERARPRRRRDPRPHRRPAPRRHGRCSTSSPSGARRRRAVDGGLPVDALTGLDRRRSGRRVLRLAALAAGAPAAELFHEHVVAMDELRHRLARAALGRPARPRARRTPGRRCSRSSASPTPPRLSAMDAAHVEDDLVDVLFTEKQIQDRLGSWPRRSRPTTRARTC